MKDRSGLLPDPRDGDAEDDASAPTVRSLIAITGSLLTEISLIKLAAAVSTVVIAPNLILGLAPLVATAWFSTLSAEFKTAVTIGSIVFVVGLLLAALMLWRPLLRLVETSFWSLNAVLVQPCYLLVRELLRALRARAAPRSRQHDWTEVGAGALVFVIGAVLVWLVWPHTRWIGAPADLIRPSGLVVPAMANAFALVMAYAAVAAVAWGIDDSRMEQPRAEAPEAPVPGVRIWRIAHVSDVHVVGERYGFRIECGRQGPRGNGRFEAVLARLAEVHAERPLDIVLFSGDMTDAGRAAEWAEFQDALARYPDLAARSLLLPGNHDVSIIDRVNPARLETPWSGGKRLRRVRTLAAMAAVQGKRAEVRTPSGSSRLLSDMLDERADALNLAVDGGGGLKNGREVSDTWMEAFPQVLPPADPGGLGLILLDTNANTHFSFTNALGLLSARQAILMEGVLQRHPGAGWIVAMHHHVAEYPSMSSAFSIRIGTALINGTWVLRQLQRHAARIIVMHGHRHVDWQGVCSGVRVVSAPSPVMAPPDAATTWLHVQNLQVTDGRLRRLPSDRVEIAHRS